MGAIILWKMGRWSDLQNSHRGDARLFMSIIVYNKTVFRPHRHFMILHHVLTSSSKSNQIMFQKCLGVVGEHPRAILDHFRPIFDQKRLKNYMNLKGTSYKHLFKNPSLLSPYGGYYVYMSYHKGYKSVLNQQVHICEGWRLWGILGACRRALWGASLQLGQDKCNQSTSTGPHRDL